MFSALTFRREEHLLVGALRGGCAFSYELKYTQIRQLFIC